MESKGESMESMKRVKSRREYQSKPGEHGTLHLYACTYRNASGDPTFTYRTWAYSLEHVADKFYDAPDADGWVLLSAQRVPVQGIMAKVPVHTFSAAGVGR